MSDDKSEPTIEVVRDAANWSLNQLGMDIARALLRRMTDEAERSRLERLENPARATVAGVEMRSPARDLDSIGLVFKEGVDIRPGDVLVQGAEDFRQITDDELRRMIACAPLLPPPGDTEVARLAGKLLRERMSWEAEREATNRYRRELEADREGSREKFQIDAERITKLKGIVERLLPYCDHEQLSAEAHKVLRG